MAGPTQHDEAPARHPAPRRRVFRGLALASAALLVGVALAGAALVGALAAGWQRDRLRAAVERQLNEALGAEVQIGAIGGPLYPFFTLRDVRVDMAGQRLLALDRVRSTWRVASLWAQRRVVIEKLAFDGLHLSLHRAPDGSWNLPPWSDDGEAEPGAAQGTTELPFGLRIALRELVVSGSRVTLDLEREQRSDRLEARFDAEAQGLGLPWAPSRLPSVSAKLRATLEPSRFGVSEAGPDAAELETGGVALALQRGQLELHAGHLEGAFGRLQLGGSADLSALLGGAAVAARAELAFSELDLERFFARPELASSLTGRLELDAQAPPGAGLAGATTQFSLALEPSQLATLGRIETARARGSLQERVWELVECEIAAEGFALSAAGRGTSAELEAVRIEARAPDLSRLSPWLGDASALAGALSLQAQLAGSVPDLRGRVALQGRALAWQDRTLGDLDARLEAPGDAQVRIEELTLAGGALPLALETPGRLRIEPDGAVRIETLSVRSGSQTLALQGRVSRTGASGLRLTARALDVGALALLARAPWTLAGTAAADLVLDGPWSDPTLSGEAQWVDPSLDERLALDRLTLALERRNGRPHGLLRAEHAGRELARVQGDLPPLRALASSAPLWTDPGLQLTLDADALDLRQLAPWLPDTAAELHGSARVALALQGASPWPKLSGTLAASDVGFSTSRSGPAGRDVEVSLEHLDLTLETRNDRLHASARASGQGREQLVAEAELPYGPGVAPGTDLLRHPATRLDATLRDLDLALLVPFLPPAVREPRGSARLDLVLRGATGGATVSGSLEVAEGSLSVPVLAQTFSPIRVSARLEGEALEIDSLRVGAPGAGAELTGRIGLAGLVPGALDLSVQFESFSLSRSSLLTADLDGSLRLGGRADAPKVTGDLSMQRTRVTLPPATDPTLKEIRIVTGKSDEAAELRERERAQGPYERAALDVRLTVPANSRVRGRGADLELAGDLVLRKRPLEEASLLGGLHVVRGSYRLYGKRFEVRRGLATFDGAARPDPLLDIEAAHRVRDVHVVAFIQGRASAPTVRIGGEPAMSESDALAYLLFGGPASGLAAGQRTSLDAAALELAAGVASSELSGLLTEVLPVDTVDFRISETGRPGTMGVGKYVTEDLFVRYGRTLGPDAEDEVSVELRLTDRWSVESELTSRGSAGADVIWRLDY